MAVCSAPNPVVVCTHASGSYLELLAMSRPSITGYADLHNWELIVDTDPSLSAGREASWGKIVLIRRLLESNEWVLWLDCDLFVVQPEYRILEETKVDKDLYLTEGLAKGHPYPYAGVMLVRSTPWSRDFFRRVWDHPGGRFAENTAIAEMLGPARVLRTHTRHVEGVPLARALACTGEIRRRAVDHRSFRRQEESLGDEEMAQAQ